MPLRKPPGCPVVQPRNMLRDPTICGRLMDITSDLMKSDVFNRCLLEILEVDRTVSNARSNDGFAYMKRRQVDLGNYSYDALQTIRHQKQPWS